ncbi:dnaJ [Symbiodinium pilosum]|uniref:DnaJ protein n=1 Tax=Symbiodinium pilosum TaxID=2952 RepID=A0A812SVZ8_SYMPI|nr:dnaJ [Symbiodinium pilosum]
MFSAKAVVGISVVLDIEKSTLGLILLLHQNGMWLAALIILVYSVLMPFAKLLVLISYAHPALRVNGLASPGAVRAVQKISKWAAVDVFTAGTICGLFCQPHLYLEAPDLSDEMKLHDGFYYFMGYCARRPEVGQILDERKYHGRSYFVSQKKNQHRQCESSTATVSGKTSCGGQEPYDV